MNKLANYAENLHLNKMLFTLFSFKSGMFQAQLLTCWAVVQFLDYFTHD